MTAESASAKQEFEAIAKVHGAIEPLEPDARARVLSYVASLLGIEGRVPSSKPAPDGNVSSENDGQDGNESGGTQHDFSTFAELFDAAGPKTQNEMALVAAYWLQLSSPTDTFNAQAASKELANLGHKLSNISKNLTALKALKPAFVLQLKKSGSSKQARKTYKVSVAGIRRVEEMISG